MEQLTDVYKTVRQGFLAGDPAVIGILVAILVVLLTILIFALRGGSNKRRAVLFVGLCDAGKTLLFSRLVYKKYVQTQTSITTNAGKYENTEGKAKTLTLIDLPGHERLRYQYIDQHKAAARAVLFVVDSLTLQKDIRDVAEFLYNILVDSTLHHTAPPLLIACNKQDQTLAKGSKVIQAQLEKEINVLRVTKSAALEGLDSKGSSNIFLGKRGKDFQFSDLKAIHVEFAECSARGVRTDNSEPDLKELCSWLEKIA